jgi:hypothetical protein
MTDFTGYYVRYIQSARLWTVGVDLPWDGSWEPESDHRSEYAAELRVHELNGVDHQWAYWRSEPGVWTVFDASGWPISDYDSEADAAAVVIRLNA